MSAQKIIFIVGNSRSGTTMLGRVFGLHNQVKTFDELQFFEKTVVVDEMNNSTVWPQEKVVSAAERLITSVRDGLFASVTSGQYTNEATRLVDTLGMDNPMRLYLAILQSETEQAAKSIPCEQTPYYLFVCQEILESYPDARVIHIYRDPRDVMLSQKNRWRRGFLGEKRQPMIWILRSWANYHPYLTSRFWTEIRYEDLLAEPEACLQYLCDHCGLEFEASMLNVPQVGSSSKRDAQGKAGFDRSRIGSWQKGGLTQTEIGICERSAAKAMEARGYELSGAAASLPIRLFMGVTLLVKLAVAFLLNVSRFRNILSTIWRRVSG